MSAVESLKKAQSLWAEGKMEAMSNCMAEYGTIRLQGPFYPEMNRVFVGPAGMLDWVRHLHNRVIFHQADFQNYTESADKSLAFCSATSYTTETRNGKKEQLSFEHRVRIDTATGLITSYTMSFTNPGDAEQQTIPYGIRRAEITLKEGTRETFEQTADEILAEAYRVDGFVAGHGYFRDDTTYISFGIYKSVAKAEASLTDPMGARFMAAFSDSFAGFKQTVTEGSWHAGHQAWRGRVFAAASNMHLKHGASAEAYGPNGMWEKILGFPGLIGVVQARHNDNFVEGVALYTTKTHAEGAAELAKTAMAEWSKYLVVTPERNIYPGWSVCGNDGWMLYADCTFKNAELLSAYVKEVRLEEGESNGVLWSTGDGLTLRLLTSFSSEKYAEYISRFNMSELTRVLNGIVRSTCFYTGATGGSETILQGWNAFEGVSLDYARPIHSNITTANVATSEALFWIGEYKFHDEKKREEYVKISMQQQQDPAQFDFMSGSRQQSWCWINQGVDTLLVFAFANKKATMKFQSKLKEFIPTQVTTEYLEKVTFTIGGYIDDDLRAEMDTWDKLPFISVNYVNPLPTSIIRF